MANALRSSAQLGDEVVCVASIKGLRKLNRAAIGQRSQPFDKQSRVSGLGLQEFSLIGSNEHCAQPLQSPHGAVTCAFQGLV
jgi:hypothetical protein